MTNPLNVTIAAKLSKETKRTFRYELEEPTDAAPVVSGSVYVQKYALDGSPPDSLAVSIDAS